MAEQTIDEQQAELMANELARQICNCGMVNPQVHWTRHGAECAFRKAMQDDQEKQRDEEAA